MKRNILIIGLATLLSACGFQLRGIGGDQLSLTSLTVQARDSHSDLQRQVSRALERNGVQVNANAPYRLYLGNENVQQQALSHSGSSRSSEYQITNQLTYSILGQGNISLFSDTVEASRRYVRDQNNLGGAEQESQQLRREINQELVQQLLQQLRQLSPAKLEQLQQEAEARAQAEAEKAAAARRAAPLQSPLQLPISQ